MSFVPNVTILNANWSEDWNWKLDTNNLNLTNRQTFNFGSSQKNLRLGICLAYA